MQQTVAKHCFCILPISNIFFHTFFLPTPLAKEVIRNNVSKKATLDSCSGHHEKNLEEI